MNRCPTRSRRARLRAVAALLAAFLPAFAPTGATEYEVKAAFLYNFARYSTWPDPAFETPQSPFVIGVLGKDPFGDALDKTVKDKKVGTRPVVVERYAALADLGSPHLLFTTLGDAKEIEALLAALGKKPVFCVGDREGFAAAGGTAGFYLADKNVRFEMNPLAAKRAGISIAAQLLKLARIVEK